MAISAAPIERSPSPRTDIGTNKSIRFFARYAGVADRELFAWAKPGLARTFEAGSRARSDQLELHAVTSADEIDQDLERVVIQILRPLYQRFNGFEPPGALIRGQISNFRHSVENLR